MEQILKYFTNLTTQQKLQLEVIGSLYTHWNQKINVISRKDIDNLYEHHILHSLAIAKFFDFKDRSQILDAGTGGGFPGLPLAIIYPTVNFVLVDSTAKKLKVVDDISKNIGLKNVTTIHCRLEDLNYSFDFAVSRAVTRLDTMWDLVGPLLKPSKVGGLIYLKGGDISNELPVGAKVKVYQLPEIYPKISYFKDKKIVYITKK